MFNVQEVKVQTRGPDRGNPTPKRQGLCCGLPWLDGRDANAQRPAKDGLKEVIALLPKRLESLGYWRGVPLGRATGASMRFVTQWAAWQPADEFARERESKGRE